MQLAMLLRIAMAVAGANSETTRCAGYSLEHRPFLLPDTAQPVQENVCYAYTFGQFMAFIYLVADCRALVFVLAYLAYLAGVA
jgi:hypothetical protein